MRAAASSIWRYLRYAVRDVAGEVPMAALGEIEAVMILWLKVLRWNWRHPSWPALFLLWRLRGGVASPLKNISVTRWRGLLAFKLKLLTIVANRKASVSNTGLLIAWPADRPLLKPCTTGWRLWRSWRRLPLTLAVTVKVKRPKRTGIVAVTANYLIPSYICPSAIPFLHQPCIHCIDDWLTMKPSDRPGLWSHWRPVCEENTMTMRWEVYQSAIVVIVMIPLYHCWEMTKPNIVRELFIISDEIEADEAWPYCHYCVTCEGNPDGVDDWSELKALLSGQSVLVLKSFGYCAINERKCNLVGENEIVLKSEAGEAGYRPKPAPAMAMLAAAASKRNASANIILWWPRNIR